MKCIKTKCPKVLKNGPGMMMSFVVFSMIYLSCLLIIIPPPHNGISSYILTIRWPKGTLAIPIVGLL